MADIQAAARTLATLTGACCSIEQLPTLQHKMPVRHVRIVVDAIISADQAFRALAA